MESRGNAKYANFHRHIGVEQVHSALRFYEARIPEETNFYANSPKRKGFNAIFHNYQLEWTPCMLINVNYTIFNALWISLSITAHVKFSVDDEVIGVVETNDGHFYRSSSSVNIWKEGNLDAPFDQEVVIRWYI